MSLYIINVGKNCTQITTGNTAVKYYAVVYEDHGAKIKTYF